MSELKLDIITVGYCESRLTEQKMYCENVQSNLQYLNTVLQPKWCSFGSFFIFFGPFTFENYLLTTTGKCIPQCGQVDFLKRKLFKFKNKKKIFYLYLVQTDPFIAQYGEILNIMANSHEVLRKSESEKEQVWVQQH